MLKTERNTITNYQEQSKGIRSTYHDEMLRENLDQHTMLPVPKIRQVQLDEPDFKYDEQKGKMKRMIGGDNLPLYPESMSYDKMLRENSFQNKPKLYKANRLNYIDEPNSEWEEPKGEMKRMTGGDNPFLQGSAGSMSYESRRKWILSSIDENLLNTDRSDLTNNSYTVDELKDFLRKLNLKVSGTKSELIERLLLEKDLINYDVD